MTAYSVIKPDFVESHAMRFEMADYTSIYCGGPSETRSSGARSESTRSESRAM
jgi:hypothetical protein